MASDLFFMDPWDQGRSEDSKPKKIAKFLLGKAISAVIGATTEGSVPGPVANAVGSLVGNEIVDAGSTVDQLPVRGAQAALSAAFSGPTPTETPAEAFARLHKGTDRSRGVMRLPRRS